VSRAFRTPDSALDDDGPVPQQLAGDDVEQQVGQQDGTSGHGVTVAGC